MRTRSLAFCAVLVVLPALVACGGKPRTPAENQAAASGTIGVSATAPPSTATASTPIVVPGGTPLTAGAPESPGIDTVIYYTVGCYACGRPPVPNLYRLRVGQAGYQTDDLLAALAPLGGYVQSFIGAWSRGELWILRCTVGRCGGEGEPSSDATLRLFASADGGVSWREYPISGIGAATFLVGTGRYGPIGVTYSPGNGTRYIELLTGREITPKQPGMEPVFVDSVGLLWRRVQTGPPARTEYFGGDGAPTFSLPGLPVGNGVIERIADGYLVSWQAEDRSIVVATVDDHGHVLRSWSWSDSFDERNYLAISGALGSKVFYGTALLSRSVGAGAGNPQPAPVSSPRRTFPIEGVLLSVEGASVHPILGLSELMTGNSSPFILHMDNTPTVRVATNGDCLNVREQPSTDARSEGCFVDGVLLRTRPEGQADASGLRWTAVLTPDGQAGWAAASFLDR